MKIVVSLTFCACFCFVLCSCSDIQKEQKQHFENGNYAYNQKNYAVAADEYEAIVLSGSEAFEVYYNLGNTYFRKGDYPRAILNYERAARLNPRNEDNLNNLALANSKIQDRFEQMPELKIITFWKNITGIFSSAAWAFITVGFIALFLLSAFFYTLFPSYRVKRTSFYTGIVFLLLTGFSVAAAFSTYYRETEKTAIVMTRAVDLLSEPEADPNAFAGAGGDPALTSGGRANSASSPIVKTVIHAGTKLQILDQIGTYYKVQLPNGEKGWVAAPDVALVLPVGT
jgi:tetratricopeptide (TPR) repeat protein